MEFDKQNLDAFARFESPESLHSDTFRSTTGPELSRIQHFADALPHPMWLQTRDEVEYFNTAMKDYLGIDLNEYGREHWQQFIHPEDLANFINEWHTALNKRQNAEIQCRIQKPDHSYHMCLLSMKFHHEAHSLLHWAITLTDIHDYFEIQQQLSQMIAAQKNMLDASLDCIKIMTPEGKLSHVNRSGRQALGLSETEQQFGMSWLNLLPAEVRPSGRRALKRAAQGMNARFAGISQLEGQAPEYWDNLLTPMVDEQNITRQILCVSRNISQQKHVETQLKAVTEIDELTGLYNRRTFYKQFKRTLFKARQQQSQVGLLLIDLDYFKHINDTLGHIAGDHLLHVLGERFQKNLGPEAIVSRLGGDEFAVLVQNLEHESQLLEVAKKVSQQMEMPISYAGRTINSGISVGGAIYPRDAINSSNLLKCADIALNDLKNSGRGGIRMFSQEMFESLDKMTRQLILARKIINSNQIIPYYQPKVRLSDGAVIGFEALLRWKDQHHQVQLPSHIFCAFQDYELASRISETMQLKVFEDMTRWQEQGLEILPISINAAPVEFLRDDYAEKLLERLSRFDIPADKVELEITEQSLSERGANYVIRALNLLKQAGIHISLDDFGTGHSSLTRLQEYPVDCIKIDRNFVERLNTDPSALAIVKAITQIGFSIELDVLVEGIENTEQLSTLINCDCQIGQGFYFYRPMAGSAAQELLHSTMC
ncbi:diguanylate cyclase [Acinetobacter sp. LoGeW2-3]|uniref:putative bifunctional diguanylate cyclase/phosphodiesterase n=1 Tax=Acinetobacter sp. LoGeW2-3 TaxID=1808001 RepID=UPI000C059DCD|nr:EAL domain-containing protein [Acinetobacter sp. LoGeW2-3]ATO19061.1 diguanylate cyclase [Acinetobacter sp. LoGeW2-3]